MEAEAAKGAGIGSIFLGLVMWLLLAMVIGFGLMVGQMLANKAFGYKGDLVGKWFKKNVQLLKGKKEDGAKE